MAKIHNVEGNLLIYKDLHAIAHQANTSNIMGAGIAAQIKRKFPIAFQEDTQSKIEGKNILGNISVGKHIVSLHVHDAQVKYIINIYGQHLFSDSSRKTNYEALYSGLEKTRKFLELNNIKEIGFPKYMGCALGGGSWKVVSAMIEDVFETYEGNVYIVEFIS